LTKPLFLTILSPHNRFGRAEVETKELELIKRIHDGDKAAETELVKNYQDAVRAKIYHDMYGDPDSHDDVAQEVFCKLLENLRQPSFSPEKYDSLFAYVWGVTRNTIREWRRRQNLEKRHFVHDDPPENYMADEVTAEQALIEQENKRELQAILRQLPQQHRRILEVSYFDGLAVREISRMERMPADEVSAKKNYALKLARKICQKQKK